MAAQPVQRLGWHNELIITQTDDPPALDQAMKGFHFVLPRRELNSHELHNYKIAALDRLVNAEKPQRDFKISKNLSFH